MKCFTGLVGAFTPEEVIFMLYMADRTRLREKGYDTLRSKRYYMENLSLIHIYSDLRKEIPANERCQARTRSSPCVM